MFPHIILLATIIIYVAYCQSDCEKFGQYNTMCIYPEGSGCQKARRGVDQATITAILSAHNTRRQRVATGQESIGPQPSAANMYELTWDEDLAAVAQRWADQCQLRHDNNRGTPKYHYAGQNVDMSWGNSTDSNPDFEKTAITGWYNGVSDFNPGGIDDFQFSSLTGHYTQLCWGETKQVGCGYAFYKQNEGNTKLYVCNYGPGGNILGSSMYNTGNPCSGCTNCSTTYPGLCSA